MTIYASASEIADELARRMALITVANGRETDIGVRVYRGRKNVDEQSIPCMVLIEGTDQPTDRPGRLPTVAVRQRYVLAAYLPCDPDNPNDAAHAAIRDIKRVLFADGGSLNSKVVKLSYAGRDIGPRVDGYPAVFVTVSIDVDYVEDLTNP